VKRKFLKAGALLFALCAGSGLLYAACALVLGLVAVNRDYREPPAGITIYLRHNGVHTDLLLPVVTQQADWRRAFPAADFGTPLQPLHTRLALAADIPPDVNPLATFVAIGWGDRGFYFDTPTWNDLSAFTAIRALSGLGDSVMHVEYRPTPQPSASLRKLTLSDATYKRLVAVIDSAFTRDAAGARRPYPGRGYTVHDTFYAAQGHFSPFNTCNEWVRATLAAAGVRVPAWAPFHHALFDQSP
jgi:uncharacterized protein (TIGR02117 family)